MSNLGWSTSDGPCWQVRHGIMLVGPTGSGKTAICETLAGALTELGVKHNIWKMNPKVGSYSGHLQCQC